MNATTNSIGNCEPPTPTISCRIARVPLNAADVVSESVLAACRERLLNINPSNEIAATKATETRRAISATPRVCPLA